jgi:type IV pilus assembly protein PilO
MIQIQGKKIFLLIVCSLALLYMLFFDFVYCAQQEEIKLRYSRLQEQQAKILRVKDFMGGHPDMVLYKEELESQLSRASAKIPDSMAQGEFLSLLQNKALEENIVLSGIVPGKTQDHGDFFSLPVEVAIQCNYFQLIAFLQSLEKSERFFFIDNVIVHSTGESMECKLHLEIYATGS